MHIDKHQESRQDSAAYVLSQRTCGHC